MFWSWLLVGCLFVVVLVGLWCFVLNCDYCGWFYGRCFNANLLICLLVALTLVRLMIFGLLSCCIELFGFTLLKCFCLDFVVFVCFIVVFVGFCGFIAGFWLLFCLICVVVLLRFSLLCVLCVCSLTLCCFVDVAYFDFNEV